MSIKTRDGKFACVHCGKKYKNSMTADECVIAHNLIYVTMTVEEANHLMMYIYQQREDIPITFINRLKRIIKSKAGKTH